MIPCLNFTLQVPITIGCSVFISLLRHCCVANLPIFNPILLLVCSFFNLVCTWRIVKYLSLLFFLFLFCFFRISLGSFMNKTVLAIAANRKETLSSCYCYSSRLILCLQICQFIVYWRSLSPKLVALLVCSSLSSLQPVSVIYF